ncbi:MAG: GNAT family N-acetyltransferase [Polyangiaceae bacterium]
MSDIEIGLPRDLEEATRFFEIVAESLLVPRSLVEPWRDREGIENARVARINGELVGGLTFQRLGQWFGGRSVPCGVVRCVGVAAEARASKVADRFLRHALQEMKDLGFPLSMLFPATQIIYRRVGYEQAGSWVEYEFPISELDSHERALPVKRVPLDDPSIRKLYDIAAQRSNGLIDRNDWMWTRTMFPPTPLELRAYVFGEPDAPEGYVVLHTERVGSTLEGILHLRDRAFTTPRAYQRARSFLAEHRSVIRAVRFAGGLIDPLLTPLPNQKQSIRQRIDWMLRILDVPAALEARGYPPGVDVELHLLVRDDILEPHEQKIVLRVRDGRPEAELGGLGRIEIDIRGLAALYTGFMAPAEVASLGYLSGNEREASALAAVFGGATSWMSEIL